MTDFTTKLDSSTNRQLKQYRDTTMQLSGTTQFGILDYLIPPSSANTINIDALQYIQSRGYILITEPITIYTGVTTVLTRNSDGVLVNTPTSGFTGGAGSGTTDNDYLTGATFNTSDGVLTMTLQSGSTVTVDLDGRYLTGFTQTDDFTTGATFSSEIITFTRQSGDTYNVDLSNTYSLTGHTHTTDNTNDYLTGATFNTSDGVLTMTLQSGSTVTVDLDGRYSLSGDTGDDYTTGATFNTTTGILEFTRQSGDTYNVDLDIRDSLTEDATVITSHDIDWNEDTHNLTLTGDVTFTESNLPSSGFTKTITIYITGSVGTEIPTWPANWTNNLQGEYFGTVLNQVVIEYIKSGFYWMTINRAD
jgi:hypothetical protein